jgi:drug/metabolite transporter (DMT)-like permease
MQKKYLYLFLLVLGTAFWGISFTFVKSTIANGSPFVFLFYKFLVAGISLSTIFYSQLKYITKNTLRIGLLIGVPLLIATIFQTIGLKKTTVSNSAFITGLDVVLIPILKSLIYRKSVVRKVWLACFLAICGLYIIVVKQGFSFNEGDFWIFSCAFGFAFYVLQVGKYSNEKYPMPSVIVLMLICAIGCLCCALIDPSSTWGNTSQSFWGSVLFAALPATAYMYAVQNIAQRYLEEEKVAMTYLCEPVFATLAGIIILKEAFTMNILIGGSLIVLAMVITELKFERYKP